MGDPTLQPANEIESLLRENGYRATVVDAHANTLAFADGNRKATEIQLTIKVDL